MPSSTRMSRSGPTGRGWSTLALVVLLAVPGCADGDGKPDDCVPVTDGAITIDGTVAGWEPDCLEVPSGTTVNFTADLLDELPHNLQVSGPGLRPIGTGDPVAGGQLSIEIEFGQAGYYQFVCTIHANMEGSIYVEK